MDKRIAVEDLNVLSKVHTVMLDLSLPDLRADDLIAVGREVGQDFKKALVKIANNEDGMNEFRDFVVSVTCLLTGPVEGALANMGYVNLPRETLVKLGKECGKEFRAKLSGAARNDHESVQWIQKKITEYGALKSEQKRPDERAVNQATKQQNQTSMNTHGAGRAPSQHPPVQASNVQNINQARKPQEQTQRTSNYQPKPKQESVGEGGDNREFFSMTFYGSSSALCFNAVEKDGDHSLTVDGGNKKPNQPDGGRAIDWQDKVIFGFSSDELIELAWVLMGIRQECSFSGHGPMHDKSFQFKRQDKGFFGSVSAKAKGARAVPISHAAGTRLMLLVATQIQKNFPKMSITELFSILRLMATPDKKVVNG